MHVVPLCLSWEVFIIRQVSISVIHIVFYDVMPAKAGIQLLAKRHWMPAYAGMTADSKPQGYFVTGH